MRIRPAAVAGSWYPGSARGLADEVDRHLAAVAPQPGGLASLVALIAPHAGLMYSGPVAAHAYRQLRDHRADLIVLVGPSHFVAFDGIAIYPAGRFDSPLGAAEIDDQCAAALMASAPIVRENVPAHAREHSLEMQLPFLRRLAPQAKILPLLMGVQSAEMARTLGDSLGAVLQGRHALLVASTDLSHYHDAPTAARLDAVVIDTSELDLSEVFEQMVAAVREKKSAAA